MRKVRRKLVGGGLLALLWLAACAHDKKVVKTRSYGENARVAYNAALKDFRKDNCTDAEPGFQQVRRDFPYSRFASLAELRLADCLAKQKKHAEAAQAYLRFVRFHPSHPEVPYAEFGVAAAYYEQIPKSWFLGTPVHERDQSATRDAVRQLQHFLDDYPSDRRLPEARRMLHKCLTLLAEHELYVAGYYLRYHKPNGAILRLQGLLQEYPGSGVEAKALLLLGQTYLELGKRQEAQQTFRALVQRYPLSRQAEKARDALR